MSEERNIFTSMIGARDSGVTTVVCGDKQEILGGKGREKSLQIPVELFESSAIALRIVTVAVAHIKVNEVDEDQSFSLVLDEGQGLVHPIFVALGVDGIAQALSAEDIFNFANTGNGDVCLLEVVEDGGAGRGEGKVFAVVGTLVGARGTDKGSGDHPAHVVGIEERPGDFAGAVEFFEGDRFFVCGNLEDTIG